MYQQSEIGLEAERGKLSRLLNNTKFDNIINVMKSARLIRRGGVDKNRLSFVHRRFAEYFVVRALQKDETRLPALDAIPSDSRWRDCLSVYCGITTEEKATDIANFCWNVVKSNINKFEQGAISETRQLIHALRFLRDSFQGNLEYLKDFQEDMAKFVKKFLKDDDILKAKLVAETVGLLKEPNRSDAIVIALKRKIPWLSQTTLRACRHLESLNETVVSWVRQYVRTMPISELFRQLHHLFFSFSLSDSLKIQKRFLWLDVAWFLGLLAFMGMMTLLYGIPYVWIFIIICFVIILCITLLYMIYCINKIIPLFYNLKFKEIDIKKILSKINNSFFKEMIIYISPRKGIDGLLKLTVLITSLAILYGIYPLHNNVVSSEEDLNKFFFTDELSYFRDNFCFNLIIMLVAIFIILPWVFWPNLIIRAKNFSLESIGKFFLKKLQSLVEIILVSYILIFYIVIIVIFIKFMEILFFPFLGILILLFIYNGKMFWQDYSLRKKLDLTGTVTENWVYKTTMKLRFNSSRYKFLDDLIAAKLPLKESNQEEKVNIPEHIRDNIKISEKLAQLKEQWHGLNE